MQLMWEALPGNAMLKTESFTVPKNGYIQCAFLTKCVATSLINGHALLHAGAHGNTFKMWAPSLPVFPQNKLSPGGVHASTEDCTNTDLLLEGIGIFLSLYFAKAAWTASVCKSKRAHKCRLAWIMNTIKTLGKHTHMITRSETLIPGVTCPGLVVFGTWVKSLGGAFDPVVNLQRRIYTCNKMTPKRTWFKVFYWQHVGNTTIILCQRYHSLEKCCWVLLNQLKHPKA